LAVSFPARVNPNISILIWKLLWMSSNNEMKRDSIFKIPQLREVTKQSECESSCCLRSPTIQPIVISICSKAQARRMVALSVMKR
jgi:hypothetical protein